MIKSKKFLLLILPALLCIALFYPLFFNEMLFQEITPLQVAYSEADYFFNSFSWIYSLNLLGEPLIANPTNGILSLQAINYLIFNSPWAYKLNFLLGFLIFYYFSFKLLIKKTSITIASLLPLVFLAAPIFLSTTQRLSFWTIVWIPVFLYIFKEAISTSIKLKYFIAGLVLSRTFSLGDPFLFILLPSLVYLLTLSKPKKELLLTIFAFSIGIFPFLYYYLELQPLMARYYGQPESAALRYSLQPSRTIELFTNTLLKTKDIATWFKAISLGFTLTLISGYSIYKLRRVQAITILALLVMTLLISFGIYFAPSKFILTSLPFLNQLRYPEKFTIYIYIILLCTIYFQSSKLKEIKYIKFILIFAVLENILTTPKFKYIDENIITQKRHLKSYQNIQTRFKVCPNGLRDYSHENIPNLRAFGIATLNSTSNISSTSLKLINCKNIINDSNAIRLGVSHLLISNINNDEKELLKSSNWTLEKSEGSFDVYKHKLASPLKAIITNSIYFGNFIQHKGKHYLKNDPINWDKNTLDTGFSLKNGKLNKGKVIPRKAKCLENNLVNIKATYQAQKFEIMTNSSCDSFLLIPWYFSPGWRAYSGENELEIFRVNDISMGIQLPSGPQKIEFLYLPNKWPLFFTYLTIFFLIASPIILKLHKNKMS